MTDVLLCLAIALVASNCFWFWRWAELMDERSRRMESALERIAYNSEAVMIIVNKDHGYESEDE